MVLKVKGIYSKPFYWHSRRQQCISVLSTTQRFGVSRRFATAVLQERQHFEQVCLHSVPESEGGETKENMNEEASCEDDFDEDVDAENIPPSAAAPS